MAVDSGTGYSELGGNLVAGVLALAVITKLVVHLTGQPHLTWPELGLLPADAATGSGSRQAVHRSLRHEGVLERGDSSEYLEEHSPNSSGGVDALVEHDQVHAAILQLLRQLD